MIIKNSNIRRMLVDNRYRIGIIIIAIILALYLIQVMNNASKEKFKEKANTIQNTIVEESNNKEQAPIIGENVPKVEQEDITSVIEQFITYCNRKEIDKAYNLLSEDCKQEVFASDIENFKKNYTDKIFTSQKIYNIQPWVNTYAHTYKVRILDDVLSTGNATSKDNVIEDYFTIIKLNKQPKLSINGYIGKEQMDTIVQENGVQISVISKNTFIEYEEYTIKVENMTENTILLDSKEKVNSIYLIGSNERNYSAYTYEIDDADITIPAGKSKNVEIRFNKRYSNETVMRVMVFEDIIMNYENYKAVEDKTTYTDRMKIRVEV